MRERKERVRGRRGEHLVKLSLIWRRGGWRIGDPHHQDVDQYDDDEDVDQYVDDDDDDDGEEDEEQVNQYVDDDIDDDDDDDGDGGEDRWSIKIYDGRRYPFAVYQHIRKWREAKQGKAELLDEGPSSLFANLRPLLICQNCQVPIICSAVICSPVTCQNCQAPIPNTNTNEQ